MLKLILLYLIHADFDNTYCIVVIIISIENDGITTKCGRVTVYKQHFYIININFDIFRNVLNRYYLVNVNYSCLFIVLL